ncbi:zf-MYND domain protein [Rhizoctonia solani AG-3 Rhs1AP]|uniref:Zf-MYND domain protein n=1 Tax=Rhizoctonia solani AG-3 Rhs1AP TaxID=1086054 RepID=X8JK99_9AGAM|nr:zf-MYND domain protein [Rhizoctonia solani AG-3 Rhs1AP]
MDGSLPLWGSPLNEYIDNYQFGDIGQRKKVSGEPGSNLTREAAAALSALAWVGDSGGPNDSKALSSPVTLANLRAILKLVQYPRAYRSLARPAVIGGCIKLMSGIKLDGRFSPFSYEYGYLCFRVLTVVLGICILDRSARLDDSIQAIEKNIRAPGVVDLLYHSVSITLCLELSEELVMRGKEDRFDWVFGWIKADARPNLPPLVMIPDIELLFAILWDDRKAFFKALKSTYHPGILAVIFVLWRVSRRERNPTKASSQSIILNEIHFRYDLIVTYDQQDAMNHLNTYIGTSIETWGNNTQQVDSEDCREVISAYIDRFNPSNPFLYKPIGVLDGPIQLHSLERFVSTGTEDLLPTVLKATVKRIWDEMKAPSELHKPDIYVDAIRDTFANYAIILQNRVFARMADNLRQELVDNIINYDLIDLAARAMLMLELPSEPPAPDRAGSIDFLPRVKHFYGQLGASIPKSYIYLISEHCLSEWLKFRNYLPWYPEVRRLIPKDREHIKKCLGIWNDIGRALGYQVDEASQFKCGYARCHDPLGMGSVQFTCPVCRGGAYCSARCQALDWTYGGLPHANSCVGAKALVKFQPSVYSPT